MPSFFYFNSLSSWKWTFPEGLGGLCHTCGNSEGVGGHQFPAKMENPGRWGGPKWNSLRGGGLDIFWNYTLASLANCSKRHVRIMELCSFYVYESFQCNQYTLHHISYIDNFIISSITSVAFSNLTASLERCSIFASFNPPSGLKKSDFQLVLRQPALTFCSPGATSCLS